MANCFLFLGVGGGGRGHTVFTVSFVIEGHDFHCYGKNKGGGGWKGTLFLLSFVAVTLFSLLQVCLSVALWEV